MLRRGIPVNWRYALGEIAIVVVGILIAIGLDNWRNSRVEQRLETEYLARLEADVRADTATYNFVGRAITRKLTALSFADSVMGGGTLSDTLSFLQALVDGSNLGWNQPALRTTTFQDLQSTGNLRLVRDQELRAQIVAYYTSADGAYDRIRARRTAYGPLTYQLVPRAQEFVLDSAAVRPRLPQISRRVFDSELSDAITAERNFGLFFQTMIVGLHERAVELLHALQRR